ncbi:N-acetyl-alpha-D-glucosaminyl-diphospho-ditrans, octacis-undecaprenol 4-epimerase [Phycisphaerales bacterium]|nr:N-acetyl-alpha-D-glucosaminyl-diphospho-ditrans, octacis-undecaprenol 4-epimerase [Phycisphaerales bacterium]
MRILVTGGSGFIGRYFHELLTGSGAYGGHQTTILDLVKPTWNHAPSAYVQGDVRDRGAVEQAMRGCDAVLHLAAAHHDFGIAEPTFFSVNEGSAKVIGDVADGLGVRRVCFYSTVAIYGDAPEPRHEDTRPEPFNPYGKSKLAGERVWEAWASRGEGRSCLVIRPTVTFGPRNFANMYTLIRQIDRGRFVSVGDGSNIKSLSYVENIVEATMHVWSLPGRPAFDPYNYIDKPDLSSREIVEQVYVSLGRQAPRMHIPLGLACAAALPFDLVIKATGKNLPISSARIKKLCTQTKFEADKLLATGFKPRVTLREGIDRMVKWYLAEGRAQKAVWNLPPAEVGAMPVPA